MFVVNLTFIVSFNIFFLMNSRKEVVFEDMLSVCFEIRLLYVFFQSTIETSTSGSGV